MHLLSPLLFYIYVECIKKIPSIPKNKIIAGPSNLYIYDVPTPIFLPFAFFPLNENRNSGFIFPTIGQNNNRGYFIQNENTS